MIWSEMKDKLKSYLDKIVGEAPDDESIELLGMIEDYAEPEGITEEAVADRITAAVEANEQEWRKKFKDRFYGRDEEETAPVADVETVENEPEKEVEKSILDYEW